MRDDGEMPGLFEPLMIGEGTAARARLSDLAFDLAGASARLVGQLPPSLGASLANLIRAMNCYYSNLIEGHKTHPVDIERALNDDHSTDPVKRDLQLEAKAHIAVQKWLDDNTSDNTPTSPEGICDIHRRFCTQLPPDLLCMVRPETGEKVSVIPGVLRTEDVRVGRHIAISPGAVPRFLDRFHRAYHNRRGIEAVLAAGCAHHRLLWVHPFLDGNGRVARLLSDVLLKKALRTGGVWSVSRGLARREAEYKQKLAACDQPRRGDLDGRGSLSEGALADFVGFFLERCLDQVIFMEQLIQPQALHPRIIRWANEEVLAKRLPSGSERILQAVLTQGELSRAEAVSVLGLNERTVRRITSELLNSGVLQTNSPRAPFRLSFPARLAGQWMPGLFPERLAD